MHPKDRTAALLKLAAALTPSAVFADRTAQLVIVGTIVLVVLLALVSIHRKPPGATPTSEA